MSINPNVFMHEQDRAALNALKAIPGFTPLLKAFMKVWSEQQFLIENMATNLRISEKQLPKYYNMLPPICEKLGIDIPDLYLTQADEPNAYTSGDTKPFIVLTSGLLETLPEHLIPSVLAHECGHIACHHVLYSTMGRIILNSASSLLGISDLVSMPIQIAFYYWMRCSEFSADRAAAICDGSADQVVETCMCFAGFDKQILHEANTEAFMEQALEYQRLVNDSKWNKTLEFLMYNSNTHPLNAVRAYECNEWCKTDAYRNITAYMQDPSGTGLISRSIPITETAKFFVGKPYPEVAQALQDLGFTNVTLVRVTEKNVLTRDEQVLSITVDSRNDFGMNDWFAPDVEIVVVYYQAPTEQELAAAHPGQIRITDSARHFVGRNVRDVCAELTAAGFTNIQTSAQFNPRKIWMGKHGGIIQLTIAGQVYFEKGDWFHPDDPIYISYNSVTP